MIAKTNHSGQILAEYIYLGDQPLAMIKPGEAVYYYHNDHLGTPQILTNDTGTVSWKANYTPFGESEITVGIVENPFCFPGQYYDSETRLHYNWNRYYDPKTGRYLTPDPIGLEGGINIFVYVANNPLIFLDFAGLACTTSDECLKCIVYAEARGTNTICLKAVAWVVINRKNDPIHFSGQTDCCKVASADKPVKQFKAYGGKNWNDCCNSCVSKDDKPDLDAVIKALDPLGPDITNGAKFFLSAGSFPDYDQITVPGCDKFKFYKVKEDKK